MNIEINPADLPMLEKIAAEQSLTVAELVSALASKFARKVSERRADMWKKKPWEFDSDLFSAFLLSASDEYWVKDEIAVARARHDEVLGAMGAPALATEAPAAKGVPC